MRVLIIADPFIAVPPLHYGGAERIIATQAAGLEKHGHQVDLLAGPGSKPFGGRLFIHSVPGSSFPSRAWRKTWMQLLSVWAARKADVVINHGRPDYMEALLRTSKPLVHVFHNHIQQKEIDWILSRRKKNIALIGVSAAQTKDLEAQSLLDYVFNSTDVENTCFNPAPGLPAYLVFLGRITHNKGADTAISVARRAGIPLKIAGTISNEPGGREFFENQIRPRLGEGIDYIGPVNDQEKQKLLGGARALLFPIRWPEPFGIVMAESLACGTPVIATRCASTPEVIEDNVTGFLCDNEDELVSAVGRIDRLVRANCRRAAEERFSSEVMTRHYLQVIERLLEKGCQSQAWSGPHFTK